MKAKFLVLLALVLGVVSCQTEPEGLDVNVGGEQTVTVNVTIPEAETRAEVDKSAKGVFDNGVLDGAATMRYIFQVFYKGEESEAERMVKYSDGKSVAFDVRLVPDREYTFVVWADVVTAEGAGDNHYDTSDLTKITLNDTWNAMDESRDAFTTTATRTYNGSMDLTLKLTRPFAKLRVVTTDIQSLTNLGIVPTKATVIYKTGYRDTFNAVEGKAAAATTNKKEHTNFAIASYGESNTGDAYTLFTDYFFAEAGDVVKFDFDVLDQDNKSIKANSFGTEISVKRNYLTTIKGNILTDGKGFEVKIEDAFAGEIGEDNGETFANVDTAEELLEALENGTENITLDGDIDLNDLLNAGILSTRAAASDVLTVAAGKNITLDLNGKTISYTKECDGSYAMIENKGTLTINDSKGNGKISFKDTSAGDPTFGWGSYTLRNEGTLVVENGTIEHLGEQNDATGVKHMYCAIFQYSGSTTINGGTISTPTYRSVRLWKGDMTINGGNFNGQVWVQAVDNSSNLTINDGTFAPSGADGSSIFITNGDYEVQFAVTGGFFNTKIGCTDATKAGVKGCIVGGTFTTSAIDNTNAALIANGHIAVDNGDGTYNVVNLRAPEVEIYGLTLKPNGDNSKVIVNDKEGFMNLTKLFNDWTALFTDGNGTTYTNYANGAGVDYYYAGRWTVSLEADIDLNNATISPIIINHPVSAGKPTFTGNNHTIKNAKIATDTATENEAGLFGSSSCGFRDLKLDNIHVTGSNVGGSTAGVLAGSNNIGIDNITITNSSVEGGKYTGGVVGYGYTDVTNCTLTNVSVKGGYKLGGLIGYICASNGYTHDVTGNTLTECSVDGIGNGIYAGGKSEYIIGMLVGNYNCDGTCQDNVVYDMTTTATKVIGKIEAGKVVNESNNIVTYVVENYEEFEAAAKAGGNIVLGADIEFTETIAINNDNFSLDGKSHTITMADTATNAVALLDIAGGKATIKNVVFDGIKEGAVVRTVNTEINIDNITAKNCELTKGQGLLRLLGKSSVTNSTFVDNECLMVISLNFDSTNNDPQVVDNCVFENNTCNKTAVVYYVKGASGTINGNKFIGNTVNCKDNGATVYMGFQENCAVTNNLFQNNTVNEAGTSSRVAGGVFFGYDMVLKGNAFIGNDVTGTNVVAKDVCVSTYYTSIDLSGNYWGGNAPVEDVNYFVQHKSDERSIILNDYLTENPIK